MTEDVYDFQELEAKEEVNKSAIRINDRYGIGISADQYTLYKIGKHRKTGADTYGPYGFYGTLQSALKAWIKCAVKDGLDTGREISLIEAKERISEVIDECNRLIESAFPEYKVMEE